MAGYARVNLKEVEDMAVKFGHSPNLEARFARGPLGLEKSGLSYQQLAPGFRGPFAHTHTEQEEIYVVLAGDGKMKLDDEIIEVRALDAIRVSPGTVREFEGGQNGLELLAFGAPNTENRDVEQRADWWTD